MTTFPAASAAAIFFVAMSNGWFQGVICATTPSGNRVSVLMTGPLNGVTLPSYVRASEAKYSSHSGIRASWARISAIGRPVWRVSREAKSLIRARRRVAALESTAKRAEASARDQAPLRKWRREEATMELTVECGVAEMVAMVSSVAGLMTRIYSAVGDVCWEPSIQLGMCWVPSIMVNVCLLVRSGEWGRSGLC